MAVADQIAVFRHADIIVGPHGAGMSNVVFGKPGAVAFELFPRSYLNGCMTVLTCGRGMHYFADAFEPVPASVNVHDDLRVDIEQLERRLDEAEGLLRRSGGEPAVRPAILPAIRTRDEP